MDIIPIGSDTASRLNEITVFEGPSHRRGFTDVLQAWHSHVTKLTADLETPPEARWLWVPHDLVAALIFRNALGRGLSKVPQDLHGSATAALDDVDRAYIAYTEPDDCGCVGWVDTDVPSGEGWWWQRVPKEGLVRMELERYYGHPASLFRLTMTTAVPRPVQMGISETLFCQAEREVSARASLKPVAGQCGLFCASFVDDVVFAWGSSVHVFGTS